VCVVFGVATKAFAQEGELHTNSELESLLFERTGFALALPDLSYYWSASDIKDTQEEGSIWVEHRKMIYYLIHWGPIEVDEITPEYAIDRIPQVWPSEGLRVRETKPMTVAGHPAVYADVLPRREFYRARFLIWNCPETGRQFIADMNYNVRLGTPIAELQAEIDATTKTLSCHPGAPTSPVPGHVVRYDEPRFGLSFSHPLRWYVFESPYAVPHPAYQGVRNDSIGSLLAWLKDRRVRMGFIWEQKPRNAETDTVAMVGDVERARSVVSLMRELEGVEKFSPEASEELAAPGYTLLKVLGLIDRGEPEDPPSSFVQKGRASILLIERDQNDTRLFIVIWIDNYTLNGQSFYADRDMFDQWARVLVSGLEN
jgi:hypothetical protein